MYVFDCVLCSLCRPNRPLPNSPVYDEYVDMGGRSGGVVLTNWTKNPSSMTSEEAVTSFFSGAECVCVASGSEDVVLANRSHVTAEEAVTSFSSFTEGDKEKGQHTYEVPPCESDEEEQVDTTYRNPEVTTDDINISA